MNHGQPRNPRTEEKAREAKHAREAYLRDLEATFGSDAGKRTLRRLRAATGCDKPRFRNQAPGKGPNPLTAAFYDGQASVILQIYEDLELDFDEEAPHAVA